MAYVPYYEYIVVGCGGVGSGAVYWLAKRAGKGVLGLEQFKLGHDNGGSQDHSRIIRLCYHDPRYTRIVRDTYRAWEEVERESGLQLVYKTGGLDFTLKGGPQEWLMEEYAKAMDAQGIPYERLDGPEIRRRFPQFEVGAETVGLYQADTGLVDAARGNSAHIQLARAHGATVIDECAVLKIDRMKNGMTLVRTSKGDFRCRRVVVAAGAWINHVLRSVGAHIPVAVTQEQVTYFATPHVKEFTKERYPTWISHTPDYDFYGLPIHGNTGSKIGIDAGGPRVTPETRTYVPDPVREKACIDFLQKYIPRSLGPIMYSKTCLYTMTMDRHFVIDTLATKGWPNVIVCCGAGHAYKFASLLGKILSQLAIDGRTQYPIDDFTMNRPAVTDPNFKPVFYMGKAKPQDTPQAKL
ncbi:monomeric sarcosine oxidase-like [Branchiostoma floridae x Branchiostoma belcheri]